MLEFYNFTLQRKEPILILFSRSLMEPGRNFPLIKFLPEKWQERLMPYHSDRLYFFMHIPKTAGTSMRKMLWSVFPEKRILPNQQDLIENDSKYPALAKLKEQPERLRRARLFAGHYPYGSERIFPQEQITRMTFMRDPVERSLSLLRHYKARDPKVKDTPFKEILFQRKSSFQNGQMNFFTGRMPKATSEEQLIHAKQALDAFDFVGISERFEESLPVLNRLLPYNLGLPLTLNQAKGAYPEELDDLRPLLAEWNQLDAEIYRYAQQRFENVLGQRRDL